MTKDDRQSYLRKACTIGILDRAILCGLGMSADSANIVMDHIEELRDEIKRLKRNSPNEWWRRGDKD